MLDQGSLERLQGLYQDLIALERSQLHSFENLLVELEERVDEFRKLVDKTSKNEISRKALLSGRCLSILLKVTSFS